MVCAYVDALLADERCKSAKRILLIAHAPLLGLYRQCGFDFLGPSDIVHGSEPWFDMALDLVARRQLDFLQVDAFTSVPLAGNPAAVLFTQKGGDESWMQAVAIENNLSETAFLEKRDEDDKETAEKKKAWNIRWFTPGGEVDLCGHATLGSAHALWDSGKVPTGDAIAFHTRKAGVLGCSMSDGWIKMDFPAQPPKKADDAKVRADLMVALGVQEKDVLFFGKGPVTTPDWLLEVTPAAFAALKPDSGAISKVKPMDRGVLVTCAGGLLEKDGQEPPRKKPRVLASSEQQAFDFASRFFAPTLGIEEDPVTGSAHCVLAPYWTEKLGKEGATLHALQASARGGLLRVRYHKATGRVDVEGQAVTVIKGRMAV